MASDFTVDRNSSKWVLGADGYLKEYIADEPAIEFNADGSYKGVLVEPQATNICRSSEDIDLSWISIDSTPTQSTETTPDGDTTNKYIKLVDDGSTGTGTVQVYQGITVVGGTKYTASVFLKKDGLDWAALSAFGAGSVGDPNPIQYFDLDNGVLGTGSAGIQDATIVAYPNNWYRCSITWTQGVGDTNFVYAIYVAEGDNDNTVDLDGTSSIFVWGAQVETGPIATSYIPTTTASVTRNKDDITLGSASSLIGQTEGTLYVEVDWRETTGASQFLLSANNGSSTNNLLIYIESGNLRLLATADGSNVGNAGASASGFSGIQKIAFAYADADYELYRNGSSFVDDTTGSLAALGTLTDVDFGQSAVSTATANLWIRAVALFTTRLSDAECEALTTI